MGGPRIEKLVEGRFSKEEVKEALFDVDEDKPPSPDDFSVAFCEEHWDTIKVD